MIGFKWDFTFFVVLNVCYGNFFSGSPNNKLVGYRSASEKASKSSSIIILVLFCSIIVFFTDGNTVLTKKNIKKQFKLLVNDFI